MKDFSSFRKVVISEELLFCEIDYFHPSTIFQRYLFHVTKIHLNNTYWYITKDFGLPHGLLVDFAK